MGVLPADLAASDQDFGSHSLRRAFFCTNPQCPDGIQGLYEKIAPADEKPRHNDKESPMPSWQFCAAFWEGSAGRNFSIFFWRSISNNATRH